MLIKQINREDAEELFVSAQNAAGETLSVGVMVCWDWRNQASHGNAIIKPTTSTLGLFAGVIARGQPSYTDWTANSFGLVQIYGRHGSVAYNVGSTSLSAAGQYLIPEDGQYTGQITDISGLGLDFTSQTLLISRGAWLMTNDISGTGWAEGFIRAM